MIDISVVLTLYGSDGDLSDQIQAISNQTIIPKEVIIINSEKQIDIKSILERFKEKLSIKYIFKKNRLFPGEARNLGHLESTFDLIAFLDAKTKPCPDWLEGSYTTLKKKKADLIFGKTQYRSKNYFQSILISSMYGKRPISTIPGMLIYKKSFNEIGGFIGDVRAGEDLEWKSRAYQDKRIRYAEAPQKNLVYSSLSKNLFDELIRSARNSWVAAKIDAQINTRLLIFGLGIIFLMLVIPNWNRYLGVLFFIPDITKLSLIIVSIVMIISYLRSAFLFIELMKRFIFPIIFISAFVAIFSPELISKVLTTSSTSSGATLYIYFLISIGFIFRAFVAPIRLGSKMKDLMPLHWISCGFIGFLNDIVKVPGYLLGASFYILRSLRRFIFFKP